MSSDQQTGAQSWGTLAEGARVVQFWEEKLRRDADLTLNYLKGCPAEEKVH